MVWNEFFLCHSLCKNFLYTGWVKILFLWVHNHMSSKFCFSLLTYLSSSPTTTVPELKSELLISTWTLLNHRCSALATWNLKCLGLELASSEFDLCASGCHSEGLRFISALNLGFVSQISVCEVCFSDLRLVPTPQGGSTICAPPYALRHTIYSLQYLYEN